MAYTAIENFIFADNDHYEALGLTYPNVSDPLKDCKGGTLTLHNIYDAFSGTAASYSLVVDGKTWTVSSKKVVDGNLSFTLPRMTSGDKVGTVYELDARGNRGKGFRVYFDVDDATAPAASGKLAVTQNGNAFNLSWSAAKDDSPYEWSLTVKDGKNVVWQNNNLAGNLTGLSINLADMMGVTGKKLSFELYAHQEITEKGKPVTLSSKKLTASAAIKDKEDPSVTVPGRIFSDFDSAELAGLSDFWLVADPLKDKLGGTLTLYGVRDAFADNVGVTSYELVVDGKTYKCPDVKVNADGGAEFKLPKMSSGFKTGTVRAVDAAGNRSAAVEVRFDVDDITAPVVSGKLAVTQKGNAFDLAWSAAKDDSPYEWSLTVKDGKNVVWQNNNLAGNLTGLSINLADMMGVTGKKLSFELYAHQEITEKGKPVTLSSKKLTASAAIKDKEDPSVTVPGRIFSDFDSAELAGLSDFWLVADPLKDKLGGTLTLYGVRDAFADNVGVTSYELVVDGKTYKCPDVKVNADGGAEFKLPKMSSRFKTGTVRAVDAAGNRSAAVEVRFDVDDITAPVVSGKLAVTQKGNAFNLSWSAAKDDSPYEWSLTVKDGKNVVWRNSYIPGDLTGLSINLADMANITGKKLSFELYAHQEITEKGKPVTLSSKKLTASAAIKDKEAPSVLSDMIFSDFDHALWAGLDPDEYWAVGDPIHNGKGNLTLYDVDLVFTDNVGITDYELVVDGKTFKTAAAKMSDIGSVTFALSGLKIGDKRGSVSAVDAAGNRSAGVAVFFDVDNKKY